MASYVLGYLLFDMPLMHDSFELKANLIRKVHYMKNVELEILCTCRTSQFDWASYK